MMFSVKQQKFVLAKIADYDNRLKVLETRMQAVDGGGVSARKSQIPADGERPDEQGLRVIPDPDVTEIRGGK